MVLLVVGIPVGSLARAADGDVAVAQESNGIGVTSFDTGLGSLVAIAFDQQANDLFIYPEHGVEILEYSTTGTKVGSGIPVPGARSNDIDLDFATESLSVGGNSVSSGDLLVPNGDAGNRLYGVDKDDGTIKGEIAMPGVSAVGGAQDIARDSFLQMSWTDDVVTELDPDDGSALGSFDASPESAPVYDVHYGDLDVDPQTGNILIVSSSYNIIRQFSPAGEWLGDVDLYNEADSNDPLRISGMSGVAIDDSTRDVWISARDGRVWRLTGLFDAFGRPPQCESDPEAICGNNTDNTIEGTPEDDTIYAGGGNDTIDGGGGNDIIVGGGGNDLIVGGDGNDVLTGDDTSGPAAQRLPGGSAVYFAQQAEQAGADVLDGGGGDDAINGNAGNDQLNGGTGADQVLGSEGNDKIAGAAANDAVSGGAGSDQVLGQGGNDKLQGNGGPDVLKGGGGVNDFNGGPGSDTCVLNNERDETRSCEKKKRNFKRNFLPTKYLRER